MGILNPGRIFPPGVRNEAPWRPHDANQATFTHRLLCQNPILGTGRLEAVVI